MDNIEFLVIGAIVLVVVALPIYFTVFTLKKGNENTRNAAKKVNIVFAAAAAALTIFAVTDTMIENSAKENYDLYREEILGSLDYVRTEDGAHILWQSALWTGNSIQVPDSVKLPLITHIYKPVTAYCEKGKPLIADELESNKHPYSMYYSGENVVKLKPNYFNLIFTLAAIIIISFSGYNFIMFIIVMNERKEKKRKEAIAKNIP